MVVTVDELEQAGLAERQPSKTDRRARVIAVTSAGAQKVLAAEEVLDRVREDVLATLPEEDRQVFLRSLGRLACGRLSEPVACTQTVRPGLGEQAAADEVVAAAGARRDEEIAAADRGDVVDHRLAVEPVLDLRRTGGWGSG